MKTRTHCQSGLSLVEVFIVIAVIVVLIFVLLPPLLVRNSIRRNPSIQCVNNLKQVGLAFMLWANDHNEQFPFASTNLKGSLSFATSPQVFRHFQALSNELVTPKVLVCPTDGKRTKAVDFGRFSNANLSYFVGLDADESKPERLLGGDRNITGGTLSNGFLRVLTPMSDAGWTSEMHNDAGNIGFSDGSTMQATPRSLQQMLQRNTGEIIRLAIP